MPDQRSETAKILKAIANNIEIVPDILSKDWQEPLANKAAVVLGISTGMGIYGLISFFWFELTLFPFTIDHEQLLDHSIYIGIAIILTLAVTTIITLGRSSRTHIVISELIIVGTLGAISTTYSFLSVFNMNFDTSFTTKHVAKVSNKRIHSKTHRYYNSDEYLIYLSGWLEDSSNKFEIDESLYHSVAKGDHVIIHYHEGFLGYRWVANVKKKQ